MQKVFSTACVGLLLGLCAAQPRAVAVSPPPVNGPLADYVVAVTKQFPAGIKAKDAEAAWKKAVGGDCKADSKHPVILCMNLTPDRPDLTMASLYILQSAKHSKLEFAFKPGAVTSGQIETFVRKLPDYVPEKCRVTHSGDDTVRTMVNENLTYRIVSNEKRGLVDISRLMKE
jgi:hypothetical protein